MNYTHNTKPETGDLETAEPATLYYGGRSAIAEPDWASEADPNDDWDDDDYEPPTPERTAAIKRDPAYIAWKQEVFQKIKEGVADIEAGRVRPIDDVVDDILRDIENGTI